MHDIHYDHAYMHDTYLLLHTHNIHLSAHTHHQHTCMHDIYYGHTWHLSIRTQGDKHLGSCRLVELREIQHRTAKDMKRLVRTHSGGPRCALSSVHHAYIHLDMCM